MNAYVELNCDTASATSLEATSKIHQLVAKCAAEINRFNSTLALLEENPELSDAMHFAFGFDLAKDSSLENKAPKINPYVVKYVGAKSYAIKNPDQIRQFIHAEHWERLFAEMSIKDYMASDRLAEWNTAFITKQTPEFTFEAVSENLLDLITNRARHTAERVDEVFRTLSPEHLTNNPNGFGGRFIINKTSSEDRASALQDLRSIIRLVNGIEEPALREFSRYLESTITTRGESGKWLTIDGGLLKIRGYLSKTMHFEVDAETANKLNDYLHILYPAQLASSVKSKKLSKRQPPKILIQKTLSDDVLMHLKGQAKKIKNSLLRASDVESESMCPRHDKIDHYALFDYEITPAVYDIYMYLGATMTKYMKSHYYRFDYNPVEVFYKIVHLGYIPDFKSHQLYPTTGQLAQDCVDNADIQEGDICLEPESGTGGLAALMPKAQTTCVEINPISCAITESMGYKTVNDNFLCFAEKHQGQFDKICMNPPFTDEQYLTHLDAAMGCLKNGGVISAILPTSFNKQLPPNYRLKLVNSYNNAFENTAVSVNLYHITRIDW